MSSEAKNDVNILGEIDESYAMRYMAKKAKESSYQKRKTEILFMREYLDMYKNKIESLGCEYETLYRKYEELKKQVKVIKETLKK